MHGGALAQSSAASSAAPSPSAPPRGPQEQRQRVSRGHASGRSAALLPAGHGAGQLQTPGDDDASRRPAPPQEKGAVQLRRCRSLVVVAAAAARGTPCGQQGGEAHLPRVI